MQVGGCMVFGCAGSEASTGRSGCTLPFSECDVLKSTLCNRCCPAAITIAANPYHAPQPVSFCTATIAISTTTTVNIAAGSAPLPPSRARASGIGRLQAPSQSFVPSSSTTPAIILLSVIMTAVSSRCVHHHLRCCRRHHTMATTVMATAIAATFSDFRTTCPR